MKLSIQGIMSDGSMAPSDLLSKVVWTVEDPSIAKIENGTVVPLKNGTTKLIANLYGLTTEVMLIVDEPVLDRIMVDKTASTINLGTIITVQ